ncbi:MAG TPA: hypothetical protein EYP14_13990, partial [Planctomycetaceae bacterium]|nr:hypothetical protein [Planctomycetaceae bacterium]
MDDQQAIVAWLHDPPDKPLQIPGHVERARRYLQVALDRPVDPSELTRHHADHVASAIERLPMPRWDADEQAVVAVEEITVVHPLSAEWAKLDADRRVDEEQIVAVIRAIVQDCDSPRRRFLALWRLLPERLSERRPMFARLPADTRIPDHTLWHHLDTTAAVEAALADGSGGAFLSFSLGPVQEFIAAARSVRDLWTGSMILAWLTFRAMQPVIEQWGPTALVYPALRGLPLLDLHLRKRLGHGVPLPKGSAVLSPCLPNRFLALVPWGEDGQMAARCADQCEQAAREAWRELCDSVHTELDRKCSDGFDGWDRWWEHQTRHFFDIRTSVLPWRESDDRTLARLLAGCERFDDAFRDTAAQVRKLATVLPSDHAPGYPQNVAGQWQYRLELSARSHEALKAVRHVPPATPTQPREMVPPKCSLMGSLEQMGPAELERSAEFWDAASRSWRLGGVRLRRNERLCAVALVKRFAGPA